jgi:hypothetical protein
VTQSRSARERFEDLGLTVVEGGNVAPVETRSRRSGPLLTPNVERMLEEVLTRYPHLRPEP